ncbi:hypothetical protein [Tenacibaculum sp. nBUS_03]|uniref:hypothetical protein n=1 Tax=Tenacibaculum sp. nBUS_03 TaxID=3395320 RepID=UPI003EBD68B5
MVKDFFVFWKKLKNGGIILCNAENKNEEVIKLNPFKINNLADYEIIEFITTKAILNTNF